MASVIVTGANRGLGRSIVEQLAAKPPITPLLILACARRPPSTNDIQSTKGAEVQWHKVDIASNSDITSFASTVQKLCPNGVDVLINNAGVNLDFSDENVKEAVQNSVNINYDGTMGMNAAFIPLMRRPGLKDLGGQSRIVNVSSVASKLSWVGSQDLAQKFKSASSTSQVDSLRDQYLKDVESGNTANGFPMGKSYLVTKSLINAGTQALAAENKDLTVNCCCPGWVQTDMGGLMGSTPAKTPEEACRIPLKLAFGKIQETGKYWENPSVADKGSGQVGTW